MKLIEFLNNKYKTNQNIYSHLSFNGGKWYIAEEDLEDFYIKYYKKIKEEENMSIIEKINEGDIFTLFFDLEIPKNKINKEIEFNKNCDNFKTLLTIIKEVIREIIKEKNYSEEYIITERKISEKITKIHLNFYKINVNTKICEGLINKIQKKLTEDLKILIDSSVYKTGLRMFYSKKSEKDIEKEIAFLKEKEIYEEKNYEKTYKYEGELSFQIFKKMCIKLNNKKLSCLEEEFKKYVKNIGHEVKLDKDCIKEVIIKEIELLTNYLQSKEEFKKYELKPVKVISNISKNNFLSYYITCKNDICPFKERKHSRESNPVYLELNNKGVYIKCYDIECSQCIYPKGTENNTWKILKEKIGISELINSLEINYIKTDKSETISEYQRELLQKSIIKQSHFSIAKCLESIYNNYRIDGLKNMEWYKFDNIRFVKSEELDEIISDDFVKYYESMKTNDTSKMFDLSNFISEDKDASKYNKTIDRLILKLEDVSFKNKIKQQFATILYNKDSDFYNMLNSNPYLIGFNNGILDLKNKIFRQGKKSDYVTFNTKIDYMEYDSDNENVKEIYEFLQKIITNKNVLEYLLLVLGKSLEGIPDEKFYIWTGLAGANGKSTLINFIESTLGDYHYSPDISLLTEKRRGSGNASPDLFMIKGRRYLTFQEPENTDRLRTGILKQYSGGDTIIARELFKSPIEFKSQGTMILCCNDLPEISSLDGGTWRRVRVIKFNSRFVDQPKAPNEFKIDPLLKEKMERWKPYFMSILYHYYLKYKEQGFIKEPEEILIATDKYKQTEDIYNSFIKTKLILTNDLQDYIKTSDIYSLFVEEWKEKNPENKWIPKQKDVINAVTRAFNIESEFNCEISDNVFYKINYR